MATTLEQVRKAYEDLSDDDKKSFHQSIADRVHESIAAQEVDSGDKDKQSAADREHEALGAEHAAGHGDVSELHLQDRDNKERDDRLEEKQDDHERRDDDWKASVDERFSRLESAIEKLVSKEAKDTDFESRMKETYGIGNGVFQGEPEARRERKLSPEEVGRKINKLM